MDTSEISKALEETRRNGAARMHLAKRANRILTVMAATAAMTLTIGVSTAAAAPHSAAAHAAASKTLTSDSSPSPSSSPPPPPQPSGCNSNNFCEYNQGNGGDLCFQTSSDSSHWPTACADHNDGEYNRNGNAVYMYDTGNYGGCYYLLYSGHYLLYNTQDYFQGGGDDCTSTELYDVLVSSQFV